VIVTQLAMWVALFKDVPLYGFANYYPAVLCTAFQTIILLPLLFPGYGTIAQTSLIPHLFRQHRERRAALG
jgi:hypothetical protein